MSAYLLTRGINEVYIALYNGTASVMGIASTFFTPKLLKRYGIEKTGTLPPSSPYPSSPSL